MSSQDRVNKKFYIHTLGCKVNQYESQSIRESLVRAGLEESDSKDLADICILNTCTVTEKADKESRYLIGAFTRANPQAKVVVTGCYAEKDAGEIASLRGVSHIVKNADKNRIADLLTDIRFAIDDGRARSISPGITGFKGHAKAFVKIQDGCENACAYCKVPLVRGALKSRPLNDVVSEVGGLVKNGYKEIVLTGICLGAWGRDYCPDETARQFGLSGATLIDLLDAVGKIGGEFRIRLSSIEPKYLSDKLIWLIGANRRFCRHLHIPLQSGDDRVLGMMNRCYSSRDYTALADKARSIVEGVAITTDILVGFPGESEDEFRNSLEFVRELSPARTHIFTFSRRFGTAAYSMDGQVDPVTAKRRHHEMEGVALNASYLFARSFLGTTLDVLVENRREVDSGLLTGYTDNYIKVLFAGPDDMMGRLVPVRITETDPQHTIGIYAG